MSIHGQTVFFTGNFPDFNHRLLTHEHGGTFAERMSKKVTWVVCGEKAKPGDIDKGKAAGARILTLEEFAAYLDPQRSVFTLDDVHGETEPSVLLAQLKQKSWQRVERAQRVQLAALLRQHEAKHGVTEVHRFCTECLCECVGLALNHPFHHEGPINGFDLSPDGRHLAISAWIHPGYDPMASVMQVWDVAERRVLRQFVVRGGIGWRDRNEVQWSPDGRLLAASFDTNQVGVWDIMSEADSPAPIAFAGVTDGWPEPPGFLWASDSSQLFISAPFFAKRYADPSAVVDESKGTWMSARGTGRGKATDVLSSCVEGLEADHPTQARRAVAQAAGKTTFHGVNNTRIVLGPRSLEFIGPSDNVRFDFEQAPPTTTRKLGLTSHVGSSFALLLRPLGAGLVGIPAAVVVVVGSGLADTLSLHSMGVFWPARWASICTYGTQAEAEAVHGALTVY